MNLPKLSDRPLCAASFVRRDARLADVGTDHAYLPIHLMLTDRITCALATDIHRGPILRAEEHIRRFGLTDKITVRLADGLAGAEDFAPTDILILGMGGELIVRILEDAPFTRNGSVRLILQPMTHPEILRAFLCGQGYTIEEEALVDEDGRIYQIICASFTGVQEAYGCLDLHCGRKNRLRGGALYNALLAHNAEILRRRIAGKESAAADAGAEKELLAEMEELLP